MIIAIDGPAASGKSTVARELAARLGLTYLDTGAMYRAVTLAALEAGVDPEDAQGCGRVAMGLDLAFDLQGCILIDGHSREREIRGREVTRAVPTVASHPQVRRAIVPLQRRIAERQGVVAEGRDTTTVVFPDADHKFFLVASPAERARRRALEEGCVERAAEYERELEHRDRLDATRAVSPLRQAPDAVRVDTDGHDVEEVLQLLLTEVGPPSSG